MSTESSKIQPDIIAALRRLGSTLEINNIQPIAQGEQNYVFSCLRRGEKCILKVTDSRHRSVESLKMQLAMLNVLKRYSTTVCTASDNIPITQLEITGIPFYLVAYPYAKGVTADFKKPEHSHLMGQSLANLHTAMRQLPPYAFEKIGSTNTRAKVKQIVPSIRGAEPIYEGAIRYFDTADTQLLHGDFSASNVKIDGEDLSIFDFDNCVYGGRVYELAHSLYMVFFDGFVARRFIPLS